MTPESASAYHLSHAFVLHTYPVSQQARALGGPRQFWEYAVAHSVSELV